MRRAVFRVLLSTGLLTLAAAGAAWAHVEVEPTELPAGSREEVVVSALGEKEIPVVEVRMEVPDGFSVVEVAPVEGWENRREGQTVVWTGGEIPDGRVAEFPMTIETPQRAGEYTWNGFDEYSDGSVTEWTGSQDSDTPATLMSVGGGGSEDASHHEEEEPGGHNEEQAMPETGGPSLPAVLGGALAASLMLAYAAVRVGT